MGILKQGLVVVFIVVTYNFLGPFLLDNQLPVVVEGTCKPGFEPVCKQFRDNVASGREKGGAFAVYHQGELVVDLWGGYADPEASRPWRRDTMTMVFSVSKGVAAIVIATLVDKGLLDYKAPVHQYWPEFGQAGKTNITVEMLLSHQAGLPVISEPVSLRDLIEDPGKAEKILAAQSPIWPAGRKFGYHSLTFGLYVDTLVRKVDPKGRNIARLFREDIAGPNNLDMFMNCPPEEFHRVARIQFMSMWRLLLDALPYPMYRAMFAKMMVEPNSLMARAGLAIAEYKDMKTLNDPIYREAAMSSASVTATARGMAALYGMIAKNGPEADSALLSKKIIKRLSTAIVSGTDEVIGVRTAFGPGMAIKKDRKGSPVFGHSGYGGSNAIANPSRRVAMAYVTNHMSIFGMGDDPRYSSLENTVYTCLDQLDKPQ